ncbi:outer membrane beta-barrel protein [Herminiimonas sp. KBW02]|uniref:outer membrane beta-barrel protein n=1 Tax=Herminiimonas sp. KBW02 TaxID=2153363 RepID=UPI00131538A2|nr:outer membrane beta-barrel protein [Herminiimonas sp. KBW02]
MTAIKQLGVAVIGAALMAPLLAQAEGAYVGFNAGRANQKLNVSSDDGRDVLKENSTGYKLYGGYEFNRYFGVQGGYIDLGKGNVTYVDDDVQGNLRSKVRSFYIAATASLPINDQFAVFAKLGVSRNRVKVVDTYTDAGVAGHISESETRTTPLIGIGAAYNFSRDLAAVVEYEDFGKVAKDDGINLKANLFSVGLRYKF